MPLPRGPISGITRSLCFLADLTPAQRWLATYSMPTDRPESCTGFPRSVCPFSVAVGCCFTPGSFRVNTMLRCRAWPRTFTFWSCLGTDERYPSQRWQVLHDDASSTASLSLSIATCLPESRRLTRRLPAFLPALHPGLPDQRTGKVLSSVYLGGESRRCFSALA